MSFEPPIVDLRPLGKVIGTREFGRRIVAEHPDVRADLAVYVRVDGVRVISSPVIDEILTAWPLATPLGAGEDVADTWDLVVEDHHAAATERKQHSPEEGAS